MRFPKAALFSFAAMLIVISCSSQKKSETADTSATDERSAVEQKAEKIAQLRRTWLQEFEIPENLPRPRFNSIVTAADSGDLEAIMWFIRNGTPTNQTGQYGYTPLHRAAAHGYNDIVKFLIANGADVNQVNDDGFIPLHNAAMSGDSMTVELLMQAGSIIYSPDNNQMTPLHLAALRNNIPTAAALIRNGANPETMTSTNWTPRRVAQQYKHTEIDSFLAAKGATK